MQIDRLNGYRFEAIHLVYRGAYLGFAGKTDEALDSLAQAKAQAILLRDAYSFITAENSYAFGLVKKGRGDEAIAELGLLKGGKFDRFVQDPKEQACLASAFALPAVHVAFLEGLANTLEAANQKDKEIEIWLEVYSYSRDNDFFAGEAEAAQKVGILETLSHPVR